MAWVITALNDLCDRNHLLAILIENIHTWTIQNSILSGFLNFRDLAISSLMLLVNTERCYTLNQLNEDVDLIDYGTKWCVIEKKLTPAW